MCVLAWKDRDLLKNAIIRPAAAAWPQTHDEVDRCELHAAKLWEHASRVSEGLERLRIATLRNRLRETKPQTCTLPLISSSNILITFKRRCPLILQFSVAPKACTSWTHFVTSVSCITNEKALIVHADCMELLEGIENRSVMPGGGQKTSLAQATKWTCLKT